METNSPKLNPKPTWLEIAMGVAVLIGISLTVVPRFTQAADQQRLEGLSDTLQLVRCTLDLYRAEHNGLYPGQQRAGQSVAPMDFVRDITLPGNDGRFHYFQRFPDNPFIGVSDCRNTVTCVNDSKLRPNGKEGTAWWFNAATGEFRACDSEFHTAY
jgi:general secretion pathway protein G